jgi:23S rRNA (adenine1618-N6)-methyltransferase
MNTHKKGAQAEPKKGLHPRNLHHKRYDFDDLVAQMPELKQHVFINQYGDPSIDFAKPEAVKVLNRALLKGFYGVNHWDVPAGYLCPPIPGRADYLHYAADLLASVRANVVPRGPQTRVLDIGVGANCIYPLIGQKAYGWNFVGSDIDSVALQSARDNVQRNGLTEQIEIRKQNKGGNIFRGVVQSGERFDLVISNPPFHASIEEAQAGSHRKWRNLGKINRSENSDADGAAPVLNFGGQNTELWYPGGEEAFSKQMVLESMEVKKQIAWFSILISKDYHQDALYEALKNARAYTVKTMNMIHGQKKSRIIAWTF